MSFIPKVYEDCRNYFVRKSISLPLTLNYDYGTMTIVIEKGSHMLTTVSKSQFKPKALEFLRMVEQLKRPLTITHAGKAVVRIIPYSDDFPQKPISFQGTLLRYDDPFAPVGLEDWEVLK